MRARFVLYVVGQVPKIRTGHEESPRNPIESDPQRLREVRTI